MTAARASLRYEALDLEEAVRLLTSGSGLDAPDEAAAAVAQAVGREEPAVRWASAIARTTGWRPLLRRLASWPLLPGLLRESALPWLADVEQVQNTLTAPEATLLAALAACDAPFTWDILDVVAPTASVEGVCRLEEAGLLVRCTRAGVVAFAVPYCVRAVHRLADPEGAEQHAARWLVAWVARAEELRSSTYGTSARATLSELAFAVPLAERALLDEASARRELGLALWTLTSDAIFFASAIDFGAPAFARAVEVADACDELEPRVRARLVAARASLEQGDAPRAEALVGEAAALADAAKRHDLRAEAHRGAGWAQLASARLEAARSSFDAALGLLPADTDPRGHADALAGLGILALLSADAETARARLEEALAVHVLTRDAPREAAVSGMMALLPERLDEPPDVASLTRQLEELRATGKSWRLALVLARLGLAARARGDSATERTHLVEARAAAGLSKVAASGLVAKMVGARETSGTAMAVGVEGRSLRLPSGEAHDLSRHGPLRRVLWALAVARSRAPGVAMSTLELVELGWPGEKMKHEAATLRVYTTIRRLRGLGLTDALLTRDEGYLFDPEVAVSLEQT